MKRKAEERKKEEPEGLPTRPQEPRPQQRAAAMGVICSAGSYAEVMRWARGEINLGDLEIGEIRTRRTVTGALVLEIPGTEGHARADALAGKMAALFAAGPAPKEQMVPQKTGAGKRIALQEKGCFNEDPTPAKKVGEGLEESGKP
ncbi:uncharacterized protein LOC116840892 [Odontomachus brunneus]|uniref:uncharacterized protein LOC116840892 n=1 Tax=Odontomachus brunneus TaxID=486640 RepID=UPI0013F184D9|nr:uncharacterized protein LOC116840892 [Odontomachus brunneus]